MKFLKKSFYLFVLSIFVFFTSCDFWNSFNEIPMDTTSLSFDKDNISMKIGDVETLTLTMSQFQNIAIVVWEYDNNYIKAVTDNYGAVITAVAPGQTTIKALYANGASASCLITVSEEHYKPTVSNPYVYASRDYVSISPSQRIRISGALFGGTPSDSSGFSWSIDSPSVASLSTEGNCCWITGLTTGSSKITLRHSKATYPYSILVDVTDDGTSTPYISSNNNIVTIDLDNNVKSTINVSLMNISNADISQFSFKICDSSGTELFTSGPAVIVDTSGNICNIEGRTEGECILRVTHPESVYPLDILIRTLTHSDTSYIELTDSLLKISGNEKKEVKAIITNTNKDTDPSLFKWSFDDTASTYADWTVYNGNDSKNCGDFVEFSGKHTGSFKATVSYPGMTDRSIVVLIRDIVNESSKATTYITTDQTFISLSPDEETQINVLLKDCEQNDINDLVWSIVNIPSDGSSEPVISWLNGNGSSTSRLSRSASKVSYSENAWCRIKGLRSGRATIEISHYKAIYSTKIDIIVKTPEPPEVKKAYITYTSTPVIKLQNTGEIELSVNLTGNGNENDITWSLDGNPLVSYIPNGSKCLVKSPESSEAVASTSTLTVSHPNCDTSLVYTIYTYGTIDEFNAIPDSAFFYITSDVEHNIKTNEFTTLNYIKSSQITDKVVWNFSPSNLIEVLSEGDSYIQIKGISSGNVIAKASLSGFPDLYYYIKVKDSRIIDDNQDIYLSTNNNVVFFDSPDDNIETISVNLHNLNDTNNIVWSCSEPMLFSVASSGNTATVQPLVPNSTAVITVSHPLSNNSIEIYLRCGELYEYIDPDTTFIEPSEKIINLIAGSKEKLLSATVIHSSGNQSNEDEQGFTFVSSDPYIAQVDYIYGTNTCFIKPIKEGKTTLVIYNNNANFDCEVPIIISKPENFENTPYLTTDNNILTILEGDMEPITVSIINNNSDDAYNSYKWNWKNLNGTNFAQPVAQNGVTSMIKANSPGIQEIEITHEDCPYPLKIIVNVLSKESISTKPYIKLNKNIVTLHKGESFNICAQMLGGISSTSDNPFFTWTCSDTTTAIINPSENNCYVKGLQTGMTKITVRNSKYPSSYTRDVLIIVEEISEENVFIKPSESILRIKPDMTDLIMLNAELINGSENDSKDFIWWADDYSLIFTTSIAGECSITPKGQSGSTYIHIKHPKAKDICDILVIISEYDNFAFTYSSMNVRAGNIYFVPMQVPAQESDYEIIYNSSDNDICCVAGSKQTAYIAPRHAGSVNLTATMKTSSGDIIATSQLLLNIQEDDISIPQITIGASSIFELTEGENITLNAIISGSNVSSGEKYNLKWEIIGKKGGLLFVNGDADGTFTGADCMISALKVKDVEEFVVKVSHNASGAETYLYFIVQEKGILAIKLSTSFEQVYKSDGTFKITATVENGSPTDAKNISWSAVRQDGVNIVSVSKSKGPTCTVTPKSEGMTVVRAALPGAETKNCQVVVMPDATIKLSTSNIHVMPGETVAVDYYTEPARCAITWIEEMNNPSYSLGGDIEKYFTFTCNEVDKKLYITGKKVVNNAIAGTIKGLMTSSKCSTIPVLNVFVDYDTKLKITDTNNNIINQISLIAPSNSLKLQNTSFIVSYFPASMKLNVTSSDENIVKVGGKSSELKKNSNGQDEKYTTVTLIPIKEGTADIYIKTELEGIPGIGETKMLRYSNYYKDYQYKITSEVSAGAFSKVTSENEFILCDGEEIRFYVDIMNENCGGTIDKIYWRPLDSPATQQDRIEFGEACSYSAGTKRDELKNKFFGNNALEVSTPISSLISLDNYQSNSSGSLKVMYRLAHNFDYYKDLPGITPELNSKIHEIPSSTTGTIYNYIEDPDFDWYMVKKDLVFRVKDDYGSRTLSTDYFNNQAIIDWTPLLLHNVPMSYNYSYSWHQSQEIYNIPYTGFGCIYSNFGNNIKFSRLETMCFPTNKYSIEREKVYDEYGEYQATTFIGNHYKSHICQNCLRPYMSLWWRAVDLSQTGYATELANPLLLETQIDNRQETKYIKKWTEIEPQYNKEGKITGYKTVVKSSEETGFTGEYEYDREYKYNAELNGEKYNISFMTYPSLSECQSLNVRTNSGEQGYLYCDYVDIKPYAIKKEYVMNNPNYVVKESSSSVVGTRPVWKNFWSGSEMSISTKTIFRTLLHEHLVPCICPDTTVVDGGDNGRLVGQIIITYKKASDGQNTGIKTINVRYQKRNCQAYQANDWEKFRPSGNNETYYWRRKN